MLSLETVTMLMLVGKPPDASAPSDRHYDPNVATTLFIVENDEVPADSRVWDECTTMRSQGWDVLVVSPRMSDIPSTEVIDGIQVFRFETSSSPTGAPGYVAEYASSVFRIASRIRTLSREHRFDVVHAANPPDFLLAAARRLRRNGTATIFDHHDLSPELYEVKFGRRGVGFRALLAAERLGLGLADVVISTNESFRRVAIERGGKDPADVFVVRNGPDPSVFRPVAPDPELRRGARHLIGYAGLMGSQDGMLEAIEILAALRKRRADWRAIFAGDGEMLSPARALASKRGIADAVDFVGYIRGRERLVRLLASCDVCISPEPINPLNDRSTLLKIAEYMAVGRPIVAFSLQETRLTAGDAALFADSIKGFADAIDELLADGERRERMGRTGRERVLASLSWASSEATLVAAYDRALERAGRRRSRGAMRPAPGASTPPG